MNIINDNTFNLHIRLLNKDDMDMEVYASRNCHVANFSQLSRILNRHMAYIRHWGILKDILTKLVWLIYHQIQYIFFLSNN